MEIFEIHITGSKNILIASKLMAIKSIVVDLVKPDLTYFRTEYMTSHVLKFENYHICLDHCLELKNKLTKSNVDVYRIKIETPFQEKYSDKSCYLESHFYSEQGHYPTSRNRNKLKYLATDRVYNHNLYKSFIDKYQEEIIELCLYDDFVDEDKDWFNLYPSSEAILLRD